MSKAYSNKALPAGTVLREWRLEQVLGVGGFGIVYKGRGIYFDELVAIKEYFPSSISEREEDDTVVPIDSDAEEVHALGLKKFVEEAKLLWNLSTPTRHPNIVSVRSLFEIHGTAYMVMDFEDGMSLSKLIKDGKRWNEASLTGMFKPIAEGLDRAHRVGVLHRDIKPPNILINDDSRPVLIDFGSARFESGEATSTSVTFHTPPYAAIEQYVRTYDQGPWTDVYALGVVLYQCITGDKPPEVLERMHGGLGKLLADGDWPGYSKQFLHAVDAAMIVKPTERPQSIPKWLAMFDATHAPVTIREPEPEPEHDADATVVGTFEPEIIPVAPSPPGFSAPDKVETAVPTDPNDAKFKRAGEDTQTGKKIAEPGVAPEEPAPEPDPALLKTKGKKGKEEALAPVPEPEAAPEPVAEPAKKADIPPVKPGGTTPGKKISPVLLGGVAAAVLVLGAGGWFVFGGSDEAAVDEALTAEPGVVVAPIDIEASGGVAAAVKTLADEATAARASAASLKVLTDAATQLATLDEGLKRMTADPAQANAAKTRRDEMEKLAMKAGADFAAVLLREADGRVSRLARDLPWADPRRANAAANESPARQGAARQVRLSLGALRGAATEAGAAKDAAAALIAAQQALAQSRAYGAAIARAARAQASPTATETTEAAVTAEPTIAAQTVDPGAKGQADELFPAKFRTFNSIVREARGVADDVIDAGRGGEPDSSASQDAKDGYRIRQQNVQTARNYVQYLDTLVNSMRGDRTEREVDENISNAQETRRYLQQLRESSRASRR